MISPAAKHNSCLWKTIFVILATNFDSSLAIYGRFRHGLEFFFDPNEDGNVTCPLTSDYPKLTVCDEKVPNLELLMEPNYTSTDIGSFSMKGMWAFYTQPDYQGNAMLISISLPGRAICHVFTGSGWDPATMNPKSVRFMGNSDPELPGLSLYPGNSSHFIQFPYGPETFLDTDKPDLGSFHESRFWATSGRYNWTLYSEKDYEGESVCVGPTPDNPNDIFKWGEVKFPQTPFAIFVRSARLGCYSDTVTQSNGKSFSSSSDLVGIIQFSRTLRPNWSLENCTGPGAVTDSTTEVTTEVTMDTTTDSALNLNSSFMTTILILFLANFFF